MVKIHLIVLFFLLFVFNPLVANAANLSISPSSGTYMVGETITVRAVISGDVPLNAISGSILFPTGIFSIQSVSKNTSILNFWVTEPSFGKGSGVVRFEGVVLGGFQGSTGTIVTISLKALKTGSGTISFQNGQVLANDGQGTDITGSLSGATFTINEAIKKPKVVEVLPEVEKEQPIPTLNPPEIVRGTKYGVLTILGISDYPKAQVLLTFVAEDGVKVFITDTASTDGSFSLAVPNSLKRGKYTVTAVMIKGDKTNSATSNIITIEIGNIFSDLGWEIIILIVILILLIIYLLLRIYFHFGKNRNIHKAIKREVFDAEKITRKSFDILRSDIHDYEHNKLNKTDRKIISGIEKDLDDAEGIITKEIKDIESI